MIGDWTQFVRAIGYNLKYFLYHHIGVIFCVRLSASIINQSSNEPSYSDHVWMTSCHHQSTGVLSADR